MEVKQSAYSRELKIAAIALRRAREALLEQEWPTTEQEQSDCEEVRTAYMRLQWLELQARRGE